MTNDETQNDESMTKHPNDEGRIVRPISSFGHSSFVH